MKIENKSNKASKETNYDEKTLNGVSMRVYPSGFASLSFEVTGGTVVINGFIRERKKTNEKFFSFPSYKSGDEWHNQAYTIGEDLSATIQLLVDTLVE